MTAENRTDEGSTREGSDEFVITRVLAAPPALVYRAWTEPELMSQWWGPRGFVNPVCQLDPRPGGAWRIVMRGPDGADHPAKGFYREVDPPHRLVMTIDHSELSDEWHEMVDPQRPRGAARPKIEGLLTVTCVDEGGQTKLTVCVRFESAAVRDALLRIGMNEGWSSSLERLAEVVGDDSTGSASTGGDLAGSPEREIVTTRVLDAPPELVFAAWTDPQRIVAWWGPRGFSTTVHEMDVRPGGLWRFVMHGPDGRDYPNENRYVEIVPPERIVFQHESTPKFRMVATFVPEAGKTRLTMRMTFETAELREQTARTFGAVEGARQTVERLAEFLATSAAR